MKTISIITFHMLLLMNTKFIAQNNSVTSGIYLTAKGFENNNLIQEADCKNDKQKFDVHRFLSKPYFDVISKNKKITYQKNEVYAYRDCEDNVWRFYNNKEYQIKETKDIYIYS